MVGRTARCYLQSMIHGSRGSGPLYLFNLLLVNLLHIEVQDKSGGAGWRGGEGHGHGRRGRAGTHMIFFGDGKTYTHLL